MCRNDANSSKGDKNRVECEIKSIEHSIHCNERLAIKIESSTLNCIHSVPFNILEGLSIESFAKEIEDALYGFVQNEEN